MKIVATSDTHFPDWDKLIPEGDVLIHCGDLMYAGTPDEWYSRIEGFKHLRHPRKLFIPGNHDLHVQIYAGPAIAELKKLGVEVVGWGRNDIVTLENGMTVLGLPWVTGLPTWAFNKTEMACAELIEHLPRVDIVASHSPPYRILSRLRSSGSHAGVSAWRKYAEKMQPSYWFCGHVHESYGTFENRHTKFYNVSMCDHDYNMVNSPIVIEV